MPPETPPVGPGIVPNLQAPAGTPTAAPGVAAVPGQPGENLQTLYARLASAEQARVSAEGRYTEAARTIGRQGQELGQYRRAYYGGEGSPGNGGGVPAGAPGYGYNPEGAAPGQNAGTYRSPLVNDPVYEQGRKRQEIMEFRINNPGLTPQAWQRLVAYATNPVNEGAVTVYNEFGQIDFMRSYQFAQNQLELTDFHAARANAGGYGATGMVSQGLPMQPGMVAPQPGQPVYPPHASAAAPGMPVYPQAEPQISGYTPGVVPYPNQPPPVVQGAPYTPAQPGLPMAPAMPGAQPPVPSGYQQPAWMYGAPVAPPAAGYATPPGYAAPPGYAPQQHSGMLSGGSSAVGPEPFDIRNASAADILMKGGLQYDMADPPMAMRR